MSNFENHVKSDTIKWVLTLLAFVLVGVMLAGIICGWFERKEPAPEEEQTVQSGGLVVDPETDEASPMLLSTMKIAPADYAAYGVMPIAESAYKVTASVRDEGGSTPDYLQKVKWTMAWKSSNSAAVTTFVTMTEDGASATFSCLKAFSTQIVVTCTSTLDTGKSATVTLDYAKRLTGVKVQFLDGSEQTVGKSGTTVTATFPANYTIGGSSPVTSGNFIANKLFWYKSMVFGAEGSIDNSASCDVTITPTSTFKSAYNTYKSTSVSGLTESVTTNHNASNSEEAIRNVNGFYAAIAGTSTNQAALAGMGIYHALSTAFYNTSSAQFTVKLTLNLRYGGTETYTYSLKVLMDKAPVANVTVDHSSFVF